MRFKKGDVLAHLTLARSIKITGIYKKRYTYEGTESPGDKLGFVGVGDADLIESNYIIKEEVGTLDEQTIMFWNLQLQFMEMDEVALTNIFDEYDLEDFIKENEYTKKARSISQKKWDLTEDEHNCLATHLALQLSGLA